MNILDRIASGIDRTRRVIPGYFEKTLAQRAGLSGKAVGSIFEDVDESTLEQMLRGAEWEPYSHKDLLPETTAFKAAIPGRLGIIDLRSMSADSVVRLDDRKGTGQVSCVVSGVRGQIVPFTVLILGPEQGEEVVFTFHPGDPVRASQVQAEPGMHGRQVTVAEALAMGLETAKIE